MSRNKQTEISAIQFAAGELVGLLPRLPWHGLLAVKRHFNQARRDVDRILARPPSARRPELRRQRTA